jgi:transcription termination factor Rho
MENSSQSNPPAPAPVAQPAVAASPAPAAPAPVSNEIRVQGVLDFTNDKAGTLLDPAKCGKTRPTDPYLPKELVRRYRLKPGSFIEAVATPDPRFPNPKIRAIEKVDGLPPDDRLRLADFTQLTTITPDKQIRLETKDHRMTVRAIDLFCPVGKGTRGLIVAPPRTGKTTLLRDIAFGALENHPELHVMILLVDERPEEVTDFRRSVPGAEVWASSNDEPLTNHLRVAEICIERAKRLVEAGRHVLVLLDSITRLARAHNNARSSGKTMSGGVDSRALEKPRQLFAAARNTEEAGSLTILASALIETGSRMDEVIFQEFKGTGNMEMVLDRKVAEMRIWPAMNVASSGTRREELLIPAKKLEAIHFFRRALVTARIEEAAETMVTRISKTKTNEEFLNLIAR